jgi:hypothetical protein
MSNGSQLRRHGRAAVDEFADRGCGLVLTMAGFRRRKRQVARSVTGGELGEFAAAGGWVSAARAGPQAW